VTAPPREDLISLVGRQAERYENKTFMTFRDGTAITYQGFADQVRGFAQRLIELEVRPEERVALMLKNSLAYPVAWLGTVAAGAVSVPVNSRLKEVDAHYIFTHSDALTVFADDSTKDVAHAAAPAAVRHVIDPPDLQNPAPANDVNPPSPGPGTLANIQYTSGTTGFPKGCLLTHDYWQCMGAAGVDAMDISSSDTLLTSQPHSYLDPQWQVITTLRAGAHLVLLDSFHPSTFMADVSRFEVTVFYCVGVMPTLLMKQPESDHDHAHSLKRVYCSAIPVDQHAAIEKRWGVPWYELFGMTETGVNLAMDPKDHDALIGSGCIGRALTHNEARVVDESDADVPAGEVGELVLRGQGFMDGYHDDPEATAEFFRNGWAHTGDLVSSDAAGLIYYRGRLKQMIRRAGENISPTEIETTLAAHPDVIECAVAPVADPDVEEEIKAYVVIRPGSSVKAEELAGYVSEKLARFKVPRYWEFRGSLPHTPSERVAKHELEGGRASFLENTIDLRNH
jgi:carnitine-CoA ligase